MFAPRKMRDNRDRIRQIAFVAGFVVLAAVSALMIAAGAARDSVPPPEARVTAQPGGPNPFSGRVEPVPALTENDSMLPAADPAQATPDGSAAVTTTLPASAGGQSTSTPSPAPAGGATATTAPVPVGPTAKTVTLTYSMANGEIVIDGGNAVNVNVGDTVKLVRGAGVSGAALIRTEGSGLVLQQGSSGAFDRTYKAVAPGTTVIGITAGSVQTVTVTVS